MSASRFRIGNLPIPVKSAVTDRTTAVSCFEVVYRITVLLLALQQPPPNSFPGSFPVLGSKGYGPDETRSRTGSVPYSDMLTTSLHTLHHQEALSTATPRSQHSPAPALLPPPLQLVRTLPPSLSPRFLAVSTIWELEVVFRGR